MAATASPARRVKARRDPAVPLPPRPPVGDRRSALRNLHIMVAGVALLIGPAIEGDPAISATYDGTETITVQVRDAGRALQDNLADEALRLSGAVTLTVNGVVYVLQGINVDTETGTLATLVFEDQVSWRLKQFSKLLVISRMRSTRAQAALRLVKEASAPPLAQMAYFIPELNDRQRIAKASADTSSAGKGTGAASTYRVKGKRATGTQRSSIDAVLGEASSQRASRRVMIAAVMGATQESGLDPAATNGSHIGLFQQDPGWGTVSGRRDRTRATRAFLAGWKRKHGSVRNAPGDLAAAIEAVQVSGRASLYAQWETEATATVDSWRGSGKATTRTVVEPYEFARGSRDGEREDSWAALARWAEDVNWRRWAQGNVLYYVSDDELRAAAPALEVYGDEDWLLAPPGYDWNPDRPVEEATMRVLADRWAVRVGASVYSHTITAQGRFIVAGVDGFMVNPEVTVRLARPQTKKLEPPHTTRESSTGGSSSLLDACKTISGQDRPYLYGGGHGTKLSKITAHQALDCSSSVSLALRRAGMFPHTVAITSGEFARSWGKPGKGHDFTVWANSGHVWIEFHGDSDYKRFDTSPYGSGPSGPHLRTTARNDQASFTARHWS